MRNVKVRWGREVGAWQTSCLTGLALAVLAAAALPGPDVRAAQQPPPSSAGAASCDPALIDPTSYTRGGAVPDPIRPTTIRSKSPSTARPAWLITGSG